MKLAFVVPWYNPEPAGGAELEAKCLVEHLQSRRVPVEVFTTCVPEFRASWNINHHAEGRTEIAGIPVTRFQVDRRDGPLFDQVNKRLMSGRPVTPVEAEIYVGQSIRSRRMEAHMADHRSEYRFVFIPYMFGTTYWGTQVAPEHSYLIPCLHDEIYARLGPFQRMFHSVARVLFLARAERELARSLYGLSEGRCTLIGGGVDTGVRGDGERFRERNKLAGPFLLYVGRKDAGKNTRELIDFFCRYKASRDNPLKLVVIGAGSLELPEAIRTDIVDLGFLPASDKYDACSAAVALWQPSLNESFSLVIMESWLCGTPVLVNARCAVTLEHCLASNGGLFYDGFQEFAACVDWYLAQPESGRLMARLGKEYVQRNFNWERIVARLERAVFA